MDIKTRNLELKARECLFLLGADPEMLEERKLPLYEDAPELVVAAYSASGRAHELAPAAAAAWQNLQEAASADEISLIIISAFRSFERQWEIVSRKVESGVLAERVFEKLAPPGCSQHHSGNAIDIGTLGCEPASEEFDTTAAFAWLRENAGRFGFTMSYPKGNSYGYIYEPWHWYYCAKEA